MDSAARLGFPGEPGPPRRRVYFTCPDCRARLSRPAPADPTEPLRCFGCEAELIWRTSEQLLAQVFGEPSR